MTSAREAELRSSASTTSKSTARATAELCHAHNMILEKSKELARLAQLKMSMKRLEDKEAFYKACKESFKSKLAITTTERIWFGQLLDNVYADMIGCQKNSATRNAVICSFNESSCAVLG